MIFPLKEIQREGPPKQARDYEPTLREPRRPFTPITGPKFNPKQEFINLHTYSSVVQDLMQNKRNVEQPIYHRNGTKTGSIFPLKEIQREGPPKQAKDYEPTLREPRRPFTPITGPKFNPEQEFINLHRSAYLRTGSIFPLRRSKGRVHQNKPKTMNQLSENLEENPMKIQ